MHRQQMSDCSFVLSSNRIDDLTSIPTAQFVENVRDPWLQRQLKVPEAVYLHRSGTISNGVPFTSKMATCISLHWNDSSKPLQSFGGKEGSGFINYLSLSTVYIFIFIIINRDGKTIGSYDSFNICKKNGSCKPQWTSEPTAQQSSTNNELYRILTPSYSLDESLRIKFDHCLDPNWYISYS